MNKSKKIFIITITFLMLLGLTAIAATDINTNETTITDTTQIKTINEDTTSAKEASTSQTDNIQENTEYQETINNKNGEKTQNLKASRSVSASTFNDLNNTLTSNTYDTVTINIGNNIQLADSITINNAIKNLTINGNGKTINGDNKYRFLYINHAINFTLNNLTITNCNSTYQGSYTNRGGAILLGIDNNGCNITVSECSFINNTADASGGAIYIINSGNMKEYPVSLTVINSSFIDNTAGGHGGAISSWNSHYNITVIDSIFTNNTAKSNFGGAIFGHNGNIIAINNNFTKNSAKLGGGAIHGYGKVSIINSSFINNSAYDDTYTGGSRYGGGAINNRNSNVINCSFINNTANTFGGAIFGKSKITNTSFINNTAGMDGGAIYGEQGVYADNSSFINNSAKNGGAIYCPSVWPTIHINLTNITFINNNALINGGAIYSEQGVYVNNSSFINNTAKNGGAIFRDNTIYNCSITDSIFINNTAKDSGGAIYSTTYSSSKYYLIVNNSTFINNSASYGGAIYGNTSSNITLLNSTFTNNTAEHGGGIYGETNSTITINNSNLTHNNATNGGAIYNSYYANITINNSYITHNKANNSGGAICGNYTCNITITNTSLTNNTATRESGGAIYGTGNITITQSNLTNNKASYGGAIYGHYDSNIIIDNINLTNNTAWCGGAIDGRGKTIITNTNLTNNKATGQGGVIRCKGNMTIIKTTLTNNNADNLGGAIDNYGNLTITQSNLTNNTAIYGGGAIFTSTDSTLTITLSNLTNNKASGRYGTGEGCSGGAIYGSGNITITQSNLTHNTANGDVGFGGAIYGTSEVEKSNITIINSNLTNNNATYGGAIYIPANINITIINSNLTNNNARELGGAICTFGNLNITQSNLLNNNATYGGAIYGAININITVTNSTLINNNANSGGAIYGDWNNITVTQSNFTNNNATNGGVIYGAINSDIIVTQSNFTNNNATNGGVIYGAINSDIIVTQSNFTYNNANQGGTIMVRENSTITINNSTLSHNHANEAGAIEGYLSNITITLSNITYNNANYSGGAIYGHSSNIIITESTLSNNYAYGTNYEGGGAIYAFFNTTLNVTQSNITHNNANYGGAIFGYGDINITIINTNLTHNHAKMDGGAIGGIHTTNVTITTSNLINNTATVNGGAICGQGYITISNSNVTNNHANENGGVIYDLYYSNITLKNSNITDNYVSSNTGYVVDLHNANSIIITDNTFINNTDNLHDMLFSDANTDAEIDIHDNSYIDNFLEDTIIEPDVTAVTDNEAKSYDYHIDLNLRDVYNDTVRNGSLNVYVNDALTDTTEVLNGRAKIFLGNKNLTKRENNITVEYITQSKHYQNTSTTFTVKKEINTTLTIQAPSHMNAGETALINFTLVDVNNNPLSGETIHVLVDEEQIATLTTDNKGVVSYTFNAFGDEVVRIEATHHTSSDSFYLSAPDAVAWIDVNKIEPEIIIKHETIVPYVETNITIHLFDKDGNPIKNKTLTVNITEEGRPDITGTVTTDENGIGVFNFTPVDEGILNVNVTSPSDDIYHYASENVQISRYFITTNLVVDASSMKINQTNTISVEVLTDDGALLSGTVELDIDGQMHTLNINNGRGTYHDYKSENAGEKLLNAKFISNNPSYTNATTTEEFNVEKLPTRVTIEAINRTAGNVILKIEVFPENNTGSIVNGGNIVIESVDGENHEVIYNNTLKNGELIYLTNINETGWYEFETEYHGNDYFYGEVNNTGSIEVLLVDTSTVTYDKTALVADTITLNATVNDEKGNPINDGNITFHLDGSQLYHADGTPLEAKVENGIATTEYTLPTTYQAGKYIITAKYNGNNKYNTSSGESELKVQSSSIVTVDSVEGVALDNVTFTARVVDYHGNPVTGGYIQFNVGGKTLKDENDKNIRVLVENGIAKLSYQAESGWIVDSHPDLKVQAVYTGTSIVLANRSDTNKVTIYKRNATVTVSAPDDYVNGTLHIDAVVKDQNGSLINDGVLVFKLNGLSVKDENNKGIIAQVVNGKVHLDVKLPFAYSAKKYNLTAVYSNKIYNKATGSNTTTLKAIPTYVNATVTIKDQFSKPVVTGQIYNKFNNAILEGAAIINIKFDGISYAKKVKVNNGTFTETLEGIPIYKPGTHKVEVVAGANSHYDAVRKTITSKTTPKYNVNTEFINITRNKTTTRVQAKIVDDKNKNVQRDLSITIKLNGLSFLVNKTVTNGKVDVLIDTSTLKNRTYNLELVSGANTYYNAGNAKTELPKY